MPTIKDAMDIIARLSMDDFYELVKTLSGAASVPHTIESYLTEKRFANGRVCPHCGGIHVSRNGKTRSGKQRYICKDCGKSFGVSTNSILSDTTKKLQTWTKYIELMLKGYTIRQAAKECSISKNTAFNWRHKILDALQSMADSVVLEGIVEADETFLNASYKGNHKHSAIPMPRKAHKRGNDVHKRGISKEKVCIPCAVNRNGLSLAKSTNLGRPTVSDLHTIFDNKIKESSVLCTDKHASYEKLAAANKLSLVQIKGGKSSKGIYHIQHINSYHRNLKRFLDGFNGVSSKYLDNYLIWNNYVNYTKGLLLEKQDKLSEFIFTNVFKEKCSDIANRPAFSF